MKYAGKFVLLSGLLIVAFFLFGCTQAPPAQNSTNSTLVGGDRDAHGCIPSAGYSWCEARQKCIRPWEEQCMRVLTEDFPPFNFRSPSGAITGSSTEIVQEILRRTNQSADISMMNWSDAYESALAGPATVLYSTAKNSQRESLFKWAGPIGVWDYVLYAKKGSNVTINSLEAAKKARSICVVSNDAREQFLAENGFTNFVAVQNDGICIQMLNASETDLWLGTSMGYQQMVTHADLDPDEFGPAYTVKTNELYIAFSKDVPDGVVAQWQQALDHMKADGTYASIIGRYFGEDNRTVTKVPAGCIMSVGDVVVLGIANVTDTKLLSMAGKLNETAQNASVKSGRLSEIMPQLAAIQQAYPASVVWYALPNGTYYTTSDGLASGNLASRPYFPTVLSGKASIGDIVTSMSTGRSSVIVAVPVIVNGNTAGVLGASLFLDNLSDSMEAKLNLPPTMYFFAVAPDGKIAMHSLEGRIMQDAEFGAAGLQYLSTHQNGTLNYTYAGVAYNAVFGTSDLTGWKYGLAIDSTEGKVCISE